VTRLPFHEFRRLSLCLSAWLLASVLAACGAQQRPDGGKGYLPVGRQVPALSSADHQGDPLQLRGDRVTLLYFYPRSGTPGCIKEACAFRDSWERYSAAGVRVIGVSTDPAERQQEFAKQHGLQFPLVSDPDHVWSDAFGVGSFAGFDSRISFLIRSDATVAKVYDDVDPGVHAKQVLEDVQRLGLE
jgi:peroxiredoxin Q/BCP